MAKPHYRAGGTGPQIVREDGFANVLTGLATSRDPTNKGHYQRDPLLTEHEVEAIFTGDGLGRKIVEVPAEEATSKWLTVEGDEGGAVGDAMEVTGTQAALTNAYVWSRLYGGAVILRLINDGGDLDQPLNRNGIQEIIGYRIFHRHRVQWTQADIDPNPNSPGFGEPQFYTIQPINGTPFRVHVSRLCILDGMRLPDNERQRNNGWGASALQGVYTYLRRVGEGLGYSNSIMRDFVQSVLGVKGLTEMLAAGQDEQVRNRLKLLDVSRSVINGMVLDAESETYSKQASSVAGLADLLDRNAEALSAVARMPMTKLFGRSPAGMNATGDSDMRNWYDALAADQSRYLSPVMEALVRDIYTSRTGPTRGREPSEWSVKWNALWQPTDRETADLRKTVAEADQIYMQWGALNADEVAESRFGQGGWSMNTMLNEGERGETVS